MNTKQKRKLDKIDLNILKTLQENGRISYVDLADIVGLSTTPCMERVKRLEKDGLIQGYYARIDPQAMGYGMLVFVEISLSYQSPDAFLKFNKAVASLPYVLECHLVSGDADFLIKARIADMSEYRALLGEMLLTLPGVKNSKSYIVMEEVKETLSLPINPSSPRG
ncbi:Lrp/AsnC ligand binding domain-containing protein [uncultured Amphritea sp.]|uniref:Leucine-responsive regulatory protein n=1 Tax=Amphritea atlantica TaxID=355243 RepID=A0ABY5GR72_9GAMM|nr:Lrp/AsnC ligand binding domain-containing protein [uncultured Amphritea sp.]UTW02051.1 Lrp/AsnC ligand binding domain-containing protein [Amphritea atlantica]